MKFTIYDLIFGKTVSGIPALKLSALETVKKYIHFTPHVFG